MIAEYNCFYFKRGHKKEHVRNLNWGYLETSSHDIFSLIYTYYKDGINVYVFRAEEQFCKISRFQYKGYFWAWGQGENNATQRAFLISTNE